VAFLGVVWSEEVNVMMRKIAIAAVSAMLMVGVASPAFAGGDKMRGDAGTGTVVQHQVMDPPPFQP
jgi:hypothetical protein